MSPDAKGGHTMTVEGGGGGTPAYLSPEQASGGTLTRRATVVERHAGRVPDDPATLRELPGVGRYTAGAIASIAFERRAPVLDGNVRRVLSRLYRIDGSQLGTAEESRALWSLAERLVDGRNPGDLNQALMELGALICTPTAPRCTLCPLARSCRARTAGEPERYPTRKPRIVTTRVRVGVAWIVRGERFLLERSVADNPLRGTWEIPAVELNGRRDAGRVLTAMLDRRHGLGLMPPRAVATVTHGIMNRRLSLEICVMGHRRGRTTDRDELRWVRPDELDEVAVSGATRKIAHAVASAGG